MEKTSIILDVDTGIDDAFAVLFAATHPAINLLGITCVDGNTNIDNVVENTLKVLDAAQAPDIPVARGALRPLLGESLMQSMYMGQMAWGIWESLPLAEK
jgi:pyrimidine-specific ribonucleoside hydrolase